jgi:hypothetical protein
MATRKLVKVTRWPDDPESHARKVLIDNDAIERAIVRAPYVTRLLVEARAAKFAAEIVAAGGAASVEAARFVTVTAWGNRGKARGCLKMILDDADEITKALDATVWTSDALVSDDANRFKTCITERCGGTASVSAPESTARAGGGRHPTRRRR